MKIPFKFLFFDYLKSEGKDNYTQQQKDSMFEHIEKGTEESSSIFGSLFELWDEFTRNFSSIVKHLGVKVEYVEKESITFAEYVKLLSENIVSGSDSIAVIKEIVDGKHRYSSAYMKNGELINKQENIYFIVLTKSVDVDFNAMFAESNIIILK